MWIVSIILCLAIGAPFVFQAAAKCMLEVGTRTMTDEQQLQYEMIANIFQHRLVVVVTCCLFPLVWIGSLWAISAYIRYRISCLLFPRKCNVANRHRRGVRVHNRFPY